MVQETELHSLVTDKLAEEYVHTSYSIPDAILSIQDTLVNNLNDHSMLILTACASLFSAIIGASATYGFECWNTIRKETRLGTVHLNATLRDFSSDIDHLLRYKKQIALGLKSRVNEINQQVEARQDNGIVIFFSTKRNIDSILDCCKTKFDNIEFSQANPPHFIFDNNPEYSLIYNHYNETFDRLNKMINNWNSHTYIFVKKTSTSIKLSDDKDLAEGFERLKMFSEALLEEIDTLLWYNRKFIQLIKSYCQKNFSKKRMKNIKLVKWGDEIKESWPPQDFIKDYDHIT